MVSDQNEPFPSSNSGKMKSCRLSQVETQNGSQKQVASAQNWRVKSSSNYEDHSIQKPFRALQKSTKNTQKTGKYTLIWISLSLRLSSECDTTEKPWKTSSNRYQKTSLAWEIEQFGVSEICIIDNMKIVLFTATGAENLGDELITLCEIQSFRDIVPDIEITLFSHDIQRTKRFLLSQKVTLEGLQFREYFPHFFRKHPLKNIKLLWETLQAIKNTDHVYIGGGGLLYGKTEE